MEQYLIDDYGVIEDKEYLTKEENIKDYFSDDAYDYFDCGQGYYQDETSVICCIGDKFYKVEITAEIGSSWQDRGDRVYYVDRISSISYVEIEKPKPKEKVSLSCKITTTKGKLKSLEVFMKENKIEYQVI